MARFWLSGVSARLFGETLPWGTLLVNVSGSLIIGFFATLSGPDGRLDVDPSMRLFVMVGLVRRLHDVLRLQPADALPHAGRRMGLGEHLYRRVRRVCVLAVWVGHVLAVQLNV